MEIVVNRFITNESTIGNLEINGQFQCFTLEDKVRPEKIAGITAIPVGRYELTLRKDYSPMNERYGERFGTSFHKGMIMLKDVPDYTWVYIHIGNDHDDSEGCILVGNEVRQESRSHWIAGSQDAYMEFYEIVQTALNAGEPCFITVKDQL